MRCRESDIFYTPGPASATPVPKSSGKTEREERMNCTGHQGDPDPDFSTSARVSLHSSCGWMHGTFTTASTLVQELGKRSALDGSTLHAVPSDKSVHCRLLEAVGLLAFDGAVHHESH